MSAIGSYSAFYSAFFLSIENPVITISEVIKSKLQIEIRSNFRNEFIEST